MIWLLELLKEENEVKKALSSYKEPYGGNIALHFAVVVGNKKVIDILLEDFKSDHYALTG